MAREATSAQRVDGRTARSERTVEAVVEAFLSLIEEGELRPGAARIAEQAGVSLRTVFHHFEDLETLYTVASERQMRRFAVPSEFHGDLEARLAAFVSQRTRMLEGIAPVRRAALIQEPFVAPLAERLQWSRRLTTKEVNAAFAPELEAMVQAARRETLAALIALTEFGAWESMRTHQGLSAAQARRAMTRAVRALLAK